MVLLCGAVYVSPLGKIRIGGEAAVPILNKWRWFSIILCTTIAVGILFWGVSEPLYHLDVPPRGAKGDAAFAMAAVYMHWSITPYAIYSIPALLFALGYYNHGQKYSLGAMFFALRPSKKLGWVVMLVDGICLFALAAGMSAVLGVGMLNIAGGLNIGESLQKPWLLAMIGGGIVLTFTLSAASGLLKGIRILSAVNVAIFIAIALFVFWVGPSGFIIKNALNGLYEYSNNFISHSLSIGVYGDRPWMHAWTTFYWANWMAWAPITALFLGRISYGYTVRQFLIFNWLIPAAFGILWMSVFSGASIYFQTVIHTGLIDVLHADGPEAIIYKVFDQLPLSTWLSGVFLIAVFLSYVTAADSNTEAMSAISTKGMTADKNEPPVLIKFLWGGTIGVMAWTMVSYAGVGGVKILSNLGGLPALLLMTALIAVTVKLIITSKKSS